MYVVLGMLSMMTKFQVIWIRFETIMQVYSFQTTRMKVIKLKKNEKRKKK